MGSAKAEAESELRCVHKGWRVGCPTLLVSYYFFSVSLPLQVFL